MIQTYEGALTETDSILQRMKTLADQAANGTYQDDVDRDAIQLEFDQLNDELNQIADTDFNGVVVLNGGQMADGTKAVNGKFDYENGDAKAPTKLGKDNVNVLDSNVWDDNGVAKGAWAALNSTWTRVPGQPATYGPDSVDITFQFDKSTSSWKAISATDGASVKNVEAAGTENGGFTVKIGGTQAATVVLDQNVLTNGDTITLTFNNPASGITTPSNSGAVVADDSNFTEKDLKLTLANNLSVSTGSVDGDAVAAAKTAAKALSDANDALTSAQNTAAGTWSEVGTTGVNAAGKTKQEHIEEDTDVVAAQAAVDAAKTAKDDADAAANVVDSLPESKMTEDVNELYNQLNGATFKMSYSNQATTAGDFVLTLKNGTELVNKNGDGTAANGTEFVIGQTTFKMITDKTNGTVTITSEDGTTADGGQTYYTIGAATQDNATDPTATVPINNSTGSITWTLGAEVNEYDAGAKPSVEVAKTGLVSIANSNNYATAPLTYTDHVVLQAGARTKDSVNFTFEYSTGGIGDLKANLNCSSRADGLGTASLKLTDQKSANYAIDRIDNAINKVSMVRATFGAVQNRLEHKIDNMNVTKENITSAESRIRDTNMAEEMTNFTKNQILSQASQAMLAQANQLPQGVLQLLG